MQLNSASTYMPLRTESRFIAYPWDLWSALCQPMPYGRFQGFSTFAAYGQSIRPSGICYSYKYFTKNICSKTVIYYRPLLLDSNSTLKT